MRIILPDAQTHEQIAAELLRCLVNLRNYTKIWYDEGGYNNKLNRVHWEQTTDRLLARLEAYELRQNESITILTDKDANK